MQQTGYGLKVSLPIPYDDAVARATDALKAQGFGVLTTIDVQQTLKAKLDREFRKYVILGACNPPLADRALHAELEIGLLLPCNVIVYESGPRESVVAAMAPLAALGIVGDNPTLMSVATEADQVARHQHGALTLVVFEHQRLDVDVGEDLGERLVPAGVTGEEDRLLGSDLGLGEADLPLRGRSRRDSKDRDQCEDPAAKARPAYGASVLRNPHDCTPVGACHST